ncbi:nuclear transport factor 2 family protein [Tardiphaga sp. vice304]|uniref:nuclear transport factor 2 family protein n=1 Tax=Tardiphaga sp. vice304 TaxID=2592817 RepID=UPI001163AFED|nr:nuclear transport factor 2 family protein [Tardiphaga sp. vice304]QDM29315.1 nuclear transport factor 2 family protein [Tardiphaga sp. vice304]
MSIDPMAATIDWLDAYRAGDLRTILSLYAEDATIECRCNGGATISGHTALRAYWRDRLLQYPASDLDNLRPTNNGAAIAYSSNGGVYRCDLEFNATGLIDFHSGGPD